MSFDFCSKKAMNKNNKTPEDIICTKATTPAAKENFNLIKSLFEGKILLFYSLSSSYFLFEIIFY